MNILIVLLYCNTIGLEEEAESMLDRFRLRGCKDFTRRLPAGKLVIVDNIGYRFSDEPPPLRPTGAETAFVHIPRGQEKYVGQTGLTLEEDPPDMINPFGAHMSRVLMPDGTVQTIHTSLLTELEEKEESGKLRSQEG